jgi:hypothetical protein
MVKRNQQGFASIAVVMVVVVLAMIITAGWFVFSSMYGSPKKQVKQIDKLVQDAGITMPITWAVYSSCGPTDAFLGYNLASGYISITSEQADRIVKAAQSDGSIKTAKTDIEKSQDYFWDITGDGWKMRVEINKKSSSSMSADIPVDSKEVDGYPSRITPCG